VLKESETTELKSEATKELVKTVVAFANTRGGSIYVGIRDDVQVVGVSDADKAAARFSQLIGDTVRLEVTKLCRIQSVKMQDLDVIRIDVNESAAKPYYLRERDSGPRASICAPGRPPGWPPKRTCSAWSVIRI